MKTNQSNGFKTLVMLIITIFCLGISFVQMSIGYKEFNGYLFSGVFSFVVVLILFYLNYELHKARKNGESTFATMIWYLFFVILSFAGNFTAMYPFFMKNELFRTEVGQKFDGLRQLRTDVEVAFRAKKGIDAKVSALVSDLESQIKSKQEPGCGLKCEAILSDLERKLGRKITRIKSSDNDQLVVNYQEIIYGRKETELLNAFDQSMRTLEPKVKEAEDLPGEYGLGMIREIIDTYKKYGAEAENLVGEIPRFNKSIVIDNADYGSIKQTFRSAFSEHTFHWGTWISVFGALMVDLFVPLFILAFTTPNDKPAFSFGRSPEPRVIT